MRSSQTREPLMLAALAALSPEGERFEPHADHWAYIDGHYNSDHADQFGDNDDGHSAQELVSAYVVAMRRDVGWQALAAHSRLHDLRSTWLDGFQLVDAERVGDDEMAVVFDSVRGLRLEATVWTLLEDTWRPTFDARLRVRLHEGNEDAEVRRAAARCALKRAPALLEEEARALSLARNEVRLIELAYDAFSDVVQSTGRKKRMHSYRAFARRLPSPFDEIALAFTPYDKLRRTQLSEAGRKLVVSMLGRHHGYLHVFLVWLATVNGDGSGEVLREAIIDSEDPEEATVALRAALAIDLWGVVEEALTHPRADVRQLAFEAMVQRNGGVVPTSTFGLVADKGHRVRRSLVDALASQPERGLDVLSRLCVDTWSEYSVPDYQVQSYPIARQAAKAVGQLEAIPSEYTEQLLDAALESSDPEVRDTLFDALAQHGDEAAMQALAGEVLTARPSWTSVSAARALAFAGPRCDPELLSRARQQWFMKVHPSLAVNAAAAVGRCSMPAKILEAATWFAQSPDRRVLLVALALASQTRDEDLAKQVMGRLPPDHAARRLLDSNHTKLPHDVLDNLGDVRVVNAVLDWCGERITPRPRAAGSNT